MGMPYILVVFLTFNGHPSLTQTRYDSETACETARQETKTMILSVTDGSQLGLLLDLKCVKST